MTLNSRGNLIAITLHYNLENYRQDSVITMKWSLKAEENDCIKVKVYLFVKVFH